MTFVLCHADGIQMLPRDVNRGSHLEQWSPSALSPLQLSRLALLKQHVLSAERTHTHTHTSMYVYTHVNPQTLISGPLRVSPSIVDVSVVLVVSSRKR